MSDPPENVMEALDLVIEAEAFALCEESGRIVLILPGSKAAEVTGSEVDELLARGWIEEANDVIHVTESGRWWWSKWLKRQKRRLR